MELFNKLKAEIAAIEASGDLVKFYNKDNHAAGTRLRQNMQNIKLLANLMRTEIQQIKKGTN